MSNNDERKDTHHYYLKATKTIAKDSKAKKFNSKPTQLAGQQIPKYLSPLQYWSAAKYSSDKQNTHINIRDVRVIIYWDFNNVCIKGDVDCKNFSEKILKGLQTLRKDYEIEKIIGVGDKRRFSDKQWDAFDNDPKMEMIHIPHVDRRKADVKEGYEVTYLIRSFLVDNPSFFGQPGYAMERIPNEPVQLHLAKYFISKYFMALKIPDLEKIAPANVNPSYFCPNQHLTEYQKQIIVGNPPYTPVRIPRPGRPASESVNTVYISKTDLDDIRLLQVIYRDVVDYGPPKILMLISSDVDFASPLSELRKKGFSILLADNERENDKYGTDSTPLRSATHAGWVFSELLEGKNCRYQHNVGHRSEDYYEEN